LHKAGAVQEMDKYKVDMYALLEIILLGKVTVIKQKYMILYSGYKSDKQEFGTEFYINICTVDNFLVFELVNETICNIWVELKCYNLIFVSTLTPTEENGEEFCMSLEMVYVAVPNNT
jgi:hypothetical protein